MNPSPLSRSFLACLAAFGGLCPSGPLHAAEVEIDLTATTRIYSADPTNCEVTADESGSGARMNFDFEGKQGDWAHVVYTVPAIDQPIRKIKITAKGTPANTSFALRDGEGGKAHSWKFGPVNEGGFETYEMDVVGNKSSAPNDTEIIYPVTKIFFQIKTTGNPKGFLEVSKLVLETGD